MAKPMPNRKRNIVDVTTASKGLAANENNIGSESPLVLAIGFAEVDNETTQLIGDRRDQIVALPSIQALTPEYFHKISPSKVAAPLFGLKADVINIAHWLEAEGFTGLFCVVGPDLPRPGLVLEEIRSACPSVRVEICSEQRDCSCAASL